MDKSWTKVALPMVEHKGYQNISCTQISQPYQMVLSKEAVWSLTVLMQFSLYFYCFCFFLSCPGFSVRVQRTAHKDRLTEGTSGVGGGWGWVSTLQALIRHHQAELRRALMRSAERCHELRALAPEPRAPIPATKASRAGHK